MLVLVLARWMIGRRGGDRGDGYYLALPRRHVGAAGRTGFRRRCVHAPGRPVRVDLMISPAEVLRAVLVPGR